MRKHHWLFIAVGIFVFASCQKSYNPPDLVISGGSGSGSGSGSSASGPKLVKSESNTAGSNESVVINFEYDASGNISRIVQVFTDSSNKATTVAYRYVRNTDGKVTKIMSNALSVAAPGSGFPDSVTYNVHYPSASSAFDYVYYAISLGGLNIVDSLVYSYSGTTLSDMYEYQRMSVLPVTLLVRTQNSYSNNNLTAQKMYDTSGTNVVATYNFEYDTKVASLNTGNDAFLPGQNQLYNSKNNIIKATLIPNKNPAQTVTVNYSYQYNSNNQPVSGTAVSSINNNTVNFKFTYQ